MSTARREGVTDHLPLKPVEFLVLAVLAENPAHGYGIVQDIEEMTDARVTLRPGDVYRVIYRLRRRELLEKTERRAAGDGGDERRTYYAITDLGRRVAAAEAELMAGVAERLLGAGGPRSGAR